MDVFYRHFCDAFAVAVDEFYKVSINVVLLKPLVQTHALDDLNRAAADIDRVTPAAKAVRLLDHRNAHAVTGKPVRGSRSGNTGARDEDVFYHFDFPMNIRTDRKSVVSGKSVSVSVDLSGRRIIK